MLRLIALLAAAALLGACADAPSRPVSVAPAAARADMAPTGALRVAINFGNPILAVRDAASGEPRGVSVDLALELAKRLGVALESVTYASAGAVVDAVGSGAWDVAFLAVDPARATQIDFSPPYLLIEGAYLVPADSPIRRNDDVDREGVRVVVGRGSAYDLHLARNLKRATLVRAPTSPAVADTMIAERLEAAAGVRQQLEADAKRLAGVRLLEGRFMLISQAIAVPTGRPAGAAFVAAFVEEMKASGFVGQSLRRHGIEGAVVAAPSGQ